ncbi:MAG: S41 family peptidase [bacterium]|nr:S41 family peptidase [bacterium]
MPQLRRALKPSLLILVSILIVAASFGGGVYVGYERRPAIERVKGVLGQEAAKPGEVDFSLFWEVWSEIEAKYVDRDSIDRKKLVEGAIGGLVKALKDPYTVFLPPQQSKLFREDVRGSFGGIGAEIGMRKNILTIIAPLKGSPAERAGLKAGDKILKINATTTADLSLEEAVSFIRGPIGTKVTLAITRDDEETEEVEITRATIVIPIIETARKDDGVFYVRLMSFNEQSTLEFRRAIREFLVAGDSKFILDLRSNPGGYLDAAVDIASWFIPAGEVVAREKTADGSEVLYRSSGHRLLESVPVVVLVDQGSASASEIVAGALRDIRGVKLVGAKTFGKGSVQEVENLKGGASLKITIAKWLTPKGTSINEKGLEPDVSVEVKKEDTEAGRDPQLEKAMEILKAL